MQYLHFGLKSNQFILDSNRAFVRSFSTDVDMRKRGRGAFEEQGTSVDEVNVRIVK